MGSRGLCGVEMGSRFWWALPHFCEKFVLIHQCFQPAIARHVDTDAANGSRRVSETKTTPCSPDESKDPLQLESRKQLPTLNAIIEIDS